jgi:hypothetical protein
MAKEIFGVTALALALAVLASSCNGADLCPQCGRVHLEGPIGVQSVVNLLNAQRAKAGLYPLRLDPSLQAVARRRAVATGRTGRFNGHPPGSFSPGNLEGVGMASGLRPTAVIACGTYTRTKTYVGAAMYQRDNQSFFCVVYR